MAIGRLAGGSGIGCTGSGATTQCHVWTRARQLDTTWRQARPDSTGGGTRVCTPDADPSALTAQGWSKSVRSRESGVKMEYTIDSRYPLIQQPVLSETGGGRYSCDDTCSTADSCGADDCRIRVTAPVSTHSTRIHSSPLVSVLNIPRLPTAHGSRSAL